MSSDEDIDCKDRTREELEERIEEVKDEISKLEQFVAWKQAEKRRKKIRGLQTQLQELQKIVGMGGGNKRTGGGTGDGSKTRKGKTGGSKTMILKLPIAVEEEVVGNKIALEEHKALELEQEMQENVTRKDKIVEEAKTVEE